MSDPSRHIASIPPQDLHARLGAGESALLIDVRSPAEHATVHVAGTRLLPLDRLDPAAIAAQRAPGQAIYLFCHSGGRATQAAQRLAAAGLADCHVVVGGTAAWAAAGLPVVRGQGGIALERQVRIVAGILVLAGVGLGLGVHPGWFGLAAFVGGGLLFAGLTDWCGMGLLLARMPWNRRGAAG